MPRARKPFKSFYSSRYVFAVKLTDENIDEVATKLGGRVRETDEGLVLKFSGTEDGLYGMSAVLGQYIVVTDIIDEKYRLAVQSEEDFEKDWTVPNGLLQTRAKAEYEAEQEAKTD